MRHHLFRFSFVVLLCFHSSVSVAQAKKRIAISIADPIRVQTNGYFNPNDQVAQKADIEEKVVDALVSRLSTDQGLLLLDRQKIQEVLQEQNNKVDERFDASSGVKLGKLLGADVLIFVRVESYAVTSSQQSSNKFAYTELSTIGDVNLTVTAKALGVETESVLSAPTSTITKHEILRKSRQMASTPVTPSYNNVNRGNQIDPDLIKLRDTAIAEAAQDLSTKLTGSLGAAPVRVTVPKVVGIDSGKVMLNRGTTAGVKVGDVFQITRMADSGFKDPDTSQPIIRKKVICALTITDVEDSIALGTCAGDVPIAGDLAVAGASK